MVRTILFLLLGVVAAPAIAQVDTVSLPDSLWNPSDSVQWVRKVPYYCEGPAYEAATGNVYFTQQIGNNVANWPIWRVKPGVDTGLVWYNVKQNNGLGFDPQGRLITCQNGQLSRLIPSSTDGMGQLDSVLTTFASNVQSNDLTIGKRGDIYFSGYSDNNVYYLSAARQLTTVATGVSSSNGIEWLRDLDSNGIYVNASGSNVMYRYERDPVTGALSNRTNFISSLTTPDGGTYDAHGNRYVASYNNGEIRVYNNAGSFLGRIALRKQSGIYDSVQSSGRRGRQGNASNCVFGGTDMKTLYITGDGGLFSIRLKVPGVPPAGATALRARLPQSRAIPATSEANPRDVRGRRLTPEARLPAVRIPTDPETR